MGLQLSWFTARCRDGVDSTKYGVGVDSSRVQSGSASCCTRPARPSGTHSCIYGSRPSVLPYGLIPLAQIVALTLASVAGAPGSADLRWS